MLTKKKRSLAPKVYTKFKPSILTRHPTHEHLRSTLGLYPFRTIVRFGSTTTKEQWNNNRKVKLSPERLARVREINSVQSIKNSANKLLMKQCFTQAGIKTADWWTVCGNHINFYKNGQPAEQGTTPNTSGNLPYPIVSKHIFGSRGSGNTLHKDVESLKRWMQGKNLSNYIFEKFYNYNREYRLHVTKEGCFYTCRKMLKSDTPESQRWFRNDSNSSWIVESNEMFEKPTNWDKIIAECVKALNAVGLDLGGFDVRVQSSETKKGKKREEPDFIIIESNSACSHGEITAVKYREALRSILNKIY